MGAEGVVESGGIINKVSIELLQLVNDESFQQHSTDNKSDSMLREGRGGVVCSCLHDDINWDELSDQWTLDLKELFSEIRVWRSLEVFSMHLIGTTLPKSDRIRSVVCQYKLTCTHVYTP